VAHSTADLRAWLHLLHARGIGPARARALIDHVGSATAALDASPARRRQAGLSDKLAGALDEVDAEAIARDLDWLGEDDSRHILPLDHPLYPARLRELNDAPLVLYAIGDPEVLGTAQLAIVGSRNPTPSGAETAQQFAEHLAVRGLTITSGLALGIDGAAHRGALAAKGLTIAVAATGLDRVYPAKHRDLAREIAGEGLLVSEFPVGTPIRAEYFPRRNRIISGLSLGTLVVEAALRSGSLISARLAMEQGREVFAIPGSIHNPLARGCHQLIRQGAKLVETADDVLEELAPLLRDGFTAPARDSGESKPDSPVESNIDPAYRQLLACIDHDPQPLDVFIARAGLPAQEVASMLLMLELQGVVKAAGGGRYQLA
jgi:DNA processing protein